jgi:hypothetical protein
LDRMCVYIIGNNKIMAFGLLIKRNIIVQQIYVNILGFIHIVVFNDEKEEDDINRNNIIGYIYIYKINTTIMILKY